MVTSPPDRCALQFHRKEVSRSADIPLNGGHVKIVCQVRMLRLKTSIGKFQISITQCSWGSLVLSFIQKKLVSFRAAALRSPSHWLAVIQVHIFPYSFSNGRFQLLDFLAVRLVWVFFSFCIFCQALQCHRHINRSQKASANWNPLVRSIQPPPSLGWAISLFLDISFCSPTTAKNSFLSPNNVFGSPTMIAVAVDF